MATPGSDPAMISGNDSGGGLAPRHPLDARVRPDFSRGSGRFISGNPLVADKPFFPGMHKHLLTLSMPLDSPKDSGVKIPGAPCRQRT